MNELSVHALRARIDGAYIVPGDNPWDEARRAWNLAADQRPAAVALPESAEDVVAFVQFAREHGLRIAPQGTGHNAMPLALDERTVLLKTERMRGVEIDAERRIARVEAGVLWAEVTDAAAPHGLAGLAGSSPDVGVVGYVLGGGISWLGRRYGLAANSVTAIELVTADGRHVRTDADNEPELFWALRGGGGSFGIVTAVELQLYPISEVYAGVLFFPIERGSEVLHAWREWVQDVPDEVTSIGRFLQFPPIPDLPEPLRGKSFVVVEATFLTDAFHASELLAPLRALGPDMDTFATIPIQKLKHLHMDPEHPVPGTGDGALLRELTPETVDAFVAAAGAESGSPLLTVEIRHLGGAIAVERPGSGALGKIDAGFAVFGAGIAATPEAMAAAQRHVEVIKAALAPWDAGRAYLNFSEHARAGGEIWGDETYARLQRVKARWDGGDVFMSNHPVRPASAEPTRAATSKPMPRRRTTRVVPPRINVPSRTARRRS